MSIIVALLEFRIDSKNSRKLLFKPEKVHLQVRRYTLADGFLVSVRFAFRKKQNSGGDIQKGDTESTTKCGFILDKIYM